MRARVPLAERERAHAEQQRRIAERNKLAGEIEAFRRTMVVLQERHAAIAAAIAALRDELNILERRRDGSR